jgi:hypothetical protein
MFLYSMAAYRPRHQWINHEHGAMALLLQALGDPNEV